jgi:hypothetical protein
MQPGRWREPRHWMPVLLACVSGIALLAAVTLFACSRPKTAAIAYSRLKERIAAGQV